MTYQPMLAEAAAGNLGPRHVVIPLRGVRRRTQVIKAAVSSLDYPRRIAYLATGNGDGRPDSCDILRQAGLPVDARGRVIVSEFRAVQGTDDAWALGDCAAVTGLAVSHSG